MPSAAHPAALGIVRGYRAARIARRGLHAFDNRQWARGNMVASLVHARPWLTTAPCVVAYGDVVFHPDIVRQLCASGDDVALVYDVAWRDLWAARFARPEEDAESFRTAHGRVVEIGRRVTDLDRVEGQFMGLLRFSPDGWRLVEAELARLDESTRRALQTTQLLQLLVERGARVAAIPVHGRWCEVDSASDLALYEAALARPGWRHDWRPGWTVTRAGAHRDAPGAGA